MKHSRLALPPSPGEDSALLTVFDGERRTIRLYRGRRLVVPATQDLGALLDALGPPTEATEALAHDWFIWLTS